MTIPWPLPGSDENPVRLLMCLGGPLDGRVTDYKGLELHCYVEYPRVSVLRETWESRDQIVTMHSPHERATYDLRFEWRTRKYVYVHRGTSPL